MIALTAKVSPIAAASCGTGDARQWRGGDADDHRHKVAALHEALASDGPQVPEAAPKLGGPIDHVLLAP